LSLSTYLKKSILGFLGTKSYTYPSESISFPKPLWGGT
jgi:hypothetical protein